MSDLPENQQQNEQEPEEHAAIAFFGRPQSRWRQSFSTKWNPREELWQMLALLLFASVIVYVVWLRAFGS